MISIENVNKSLGSRRILRDINLKINTGSIFGLIGPNGAGKTTMIKMLTGIYEPDSGNVLFDGKPVFENVDVKERLGYVADENNYFSNFKVMEIKEFYRLSHKRFDYDVYDRINKIFDIPDTRPIKKLSKGMKTRLAIMLNLSIIPDVLILDEPTSGLDPIAKKEVLNLIVEIVAQKHTTVIISSHNLSELEKICDSIAIINNGKIMYTSSIEDMKGKIRKIQVVFKGEAPDDIDKWDEIIKVEKVGRVYNIITKDYSDDFKKKLDSYEIMFKEELDLSLEEMFIYSLGGDRDYEEIFK